MQISKEKIINLIEYIAFDKISCIVEATFFSNAIDENNKEVVEIDLTDFVKSFISDSLSKTGNKCLWLDNQSNFLICLNDQLKSMINIRKGGNLVLTHMNYYIRRTINKEMIFQNDMLIFNEDRKYNINQNTKITEYILKSNQNLLDISNHEILVSKQDFIKIINKMPFFNYILANTLRNFDQCVPIERKKKGVILQIAVDSKEILRLRVCEKEEDEKNNSNDNMQIDNDNFMVYILYFFSIKSFFSLNKLFCKNGKDIQKCWWTI